MSKVEYNSLLLRISERLDDINALNRILFICREKLAGEDIHDSLSLLIKLEQKGFLGVDELQEVKDILKAVKEWGLREEIIMFESTRGEYKELLERVIGVLEDLNDLEQLMSTVCRVRRIPEERKNDIHDVRSLFQVLEGMNFLGIDRLGILREIFTELKNHELLKELAEFQKRRIEHETHERRKAQGAAVWSSARTATQRIIGEVRVHCTFRTLSGVVLVVGTGLILRRCSTLEDFVEAFRTATLPAANALRAISEGSVCFTVRAETSLALEELFERYSTGRLQKDLQEFLVTDDIRQLADGEEVVVSVYIDEKEFREALDDLKNVGQEGRDDIEEKQSRFLNEERMAFVQNYLENTEDTRSLTTGTSDEGIESHSAPSDSALEEPSEFINEPCLKDLSEKTIEELNRRLRSDEVSCNHFYHSFGLEKCYTQKVFGEFGNIAKLFPDTPIKLVIDVCRALKLYDLLELFQKAGKPRTLRPALPLKEMTTLLGYSNLTIFYSKVKVVFVGDGENTFVTIRNFFKKICPGSEFYKLTPEFNLLLSHMRLLDVDRDKANTDVRLQNLLRQVENIGKELPLKPEALRFPRRFSLAEMQKELQVLRKRNNDIEEAIEQEEAKLAAQKRKLEADISRAFEKSWGEGRVDKSTLFVVFLITRRQTFHSLGRMAYHPGLIKASWITDMIMKKLTSFPTVPKLLVTPSTKLGEIPESLHVAYVQSDGVVLTILEVLSKRWQTLDLISIMKEVQRSVPMQNHGESTIMAITCNLSAIPRFLTTAGQS